MNYNFLFLIFILPIQLALDGIAHAQQIYKWTDAKGQVHYGEKEPEATDHPVQTLDIAPSPPTDPSSPNADAEIARLNALAEQMASERQAAEKARQEQAIRNLEQQNKALENALLNQKLQQQQQQPPPPGDDSDRTIIDYPPVYPYPYPYSSPYPPPYYPSPYPPGAPRPLPHQPCQLPACQEPTPPRPKPAPLAKPSPPFKPQPAGLAPTTQGVFRGR
ncbi:MAG: DUF4124 domain-containing protein [Gammaproteobacteria bacterium]|nr:DUF4124 domain-containing protein [Gammaproteobacteria bacterium]MCP5196760.1 DUF4124 domain-containing protein [Gammaproteobacteria bacterium]